MSATNRDADPVDSYTHLTAEASTLGWPPMHWPAKFKGPDCVWVFDRFTLDAEGNVEIAHYVCGDRKLTVFND